MCLSLSLTCPYYADQPQASDQRPQRHFEGHQRLLEGAVWQEDHICFPFQGTPGAAQVCTKDSAMLSYAQAKGTTLACVSFLPTLV